MTAITLLPDVERLLSDFFADQAEVLAFFTTGVDVEGTTVASPPAFRVYSEFPKTKVFPLVLFNQFGTLPVTGSPRWLETSTVQFSAYGGPKRTARLLADTCMQVMAARLIGTHDEGVVTDVAFTGLADIPDPTFDPARPRWIWTASVTAHP